MSKKLTTIVETFNLFVYVDSVLQVFPKEPTSIPLRKRVEQSIVSHREKQKQKGTDGIGWSIYGGH